MTELLFRTNGRGDALVASYGRDIYRLEPASVSSSVSIIKLEMLFKNTLPYKMVAVASKSSAYYSSDSNQYPISALYVICYIIIFALNTSRRIVGSSIGELVR